MPEIPMKPIIELLVMFFNAGFKLADAANLSREELEAAYRQAYAEFQQNDPDNLPDV
jgi:hypothetical protein